MVWTINNNKTHITTFLMHTHTHVDEALRCCCGKCDFTGEATKHLQHFCVISGSTTSAICLATHDPKDSKSDVLKPEICTTCRISRGDDANKSIYLNDKLFRTYYVEGEEEKCPAKLFSLSTIYKVIQEHLEVEGESVDTLFQESDISQGTTSNINCFT